jgi:hypothetical protein
MVMPAVSVARRLQSATEALIALADAGRSIEEAIAGGVTAPGLLAGLGLRVAEATAAVEGHELAVEAIFQAGTEHQAAVEAGRARHLRPVR